MALEALAARLYPVDGWNEEIADKDGLDSLRDYVRRDAGSAWPFFYRTIIQLTLYLKTTKLVMRCFTNTISYR